MMAMHRTERRRATVDRIAAWIVGGRYAPGDTLPIEPALGEELAVSRTVVREALKMLAAKGLVVTGPRLGTRVRPRSAWNHFDPDVVNWRLEAGVDEAFVRDLVELRLAIEPAAARLAARAATGDDIAAAEEAYRCMVRGANGHGHYLQSDVAFHESLLNATHNQFIAGMAPVFSALLRVSFRLSVRSLAGARASLPAHRRLLDAIVARKPELAEAATSALIESARADIEGGIGSGVFTAAEVHA
ncbi:MAG: FadR/GntR family transcriptional regulator [Betaproteobacteria bacterium]